MNGSKALLYLVMAICATIGAYVPVWLWGDDPLGLASVFWGMIGGFVGIWIWYKFLR